MSLPSAMQGAQQPPDPPLPRLDRLLSNPAAEFVETRAGREVCRRATGGLVDIIDEQEVAEDMTGVEISRSSNAPDSDIHVRAPKFSSSLDRFMPVKQAYNPAQSYKTSSEMLIEFQKTLQSFIETLKSRKIFKSITPDLCDPEDYNLQYVLKVASQIQEHKEGLENTRIIKRFIRKCCRGVADHNTVLNGFLSMIPNDAYGSAISGGLSLILAAVEKHEKLRVEIQTTLADIPRKLDNIHNLVEAHIKTPDLHQCANQVFMSIFVLLERVINKLSMTSFEKGIHKLKGKGVDVKEATEAFNDQVIQFQEQVDVCTQLRFGRLEDNQEAMIRMLKDVQKKLPTVTNSQQEELLGVIYTLLYRMSASDPRFNPIDGSVQELILPFSTNHPLSADADGHAVSMNKSKELAQSWLSGLGTFDPMPDKQIHELLSGFSSLSLDEKDRLQWILASDEVRDWLASAESSILYMYAETPPEELINAMSFSASTLALTLAGATNFPVLSFFCGLRQNDSRENATSGPKAVRKSLNGQLLTFMKSQRPLADLSFIEPGKKMRKSMGKAEHAKKLFRDLLEALPEGEVVFIILDSFSRLGGEPGDNDKGDDLVEELAALRAIPQLVVKLLIIDAMPGCPVTREADITPYVLDEVNGWKGDVKLTDLDKNSLDAIKQLVRQQEKGLSRLEGSSETSSGSESD